MLPYLLLLSNVDAGNMAAAKEECFVPLGVEWVVVFRRVFLDVPEYASEWVRMRH